MKGIQMFQIAAVILILTIVIGCGNETTSPTSSGSTIKNSKETQEQLAAHQHYPIRLKPHQSYSFNYTNTGYYTFNSIVISNCNDGRKMNYEVTGYMDDELLLLECISSGFIVRSITIQNLSTSFIDLDVSLSGSKIRVNPKVQITGSE